jgi:hypothetical protein
MNGCMGRVAPPVQMQISLVLAIEKNYSEKRLSANGISPGERQVSGNTGYSAFPFTYTGRCRKLPGER